MDVIETVGHDTYMQKLNNFCNKNPEKAPFLTREIDEGSVFKFFSIPGKQCGVYVKDNGELAGLFNGEDNKDYAKKLVEKAVAVGADHLYCFDGFLTGYYERFGFDEVNRFPWDEDKAPEDWDYNRFGRPDLIRMDFLAGDVDGS